MSGDIELMLQTDVVRVQLEEPNKNLKVDRNLGVLLFYFGFKKTFACAVFGIHRVKVLLCDNVFSLSAAHFCAEIARKYPFQSKNETVKFYPRPFVSIVYPFVSIVYPFVSKVRPFV